MTQHAFSQKVNKREQKKQERERVIAEKKRVKEEKRLKKLEPPPNIEYLPKKFLFRVKYSLPGVVLDVMPRTGSGKTIDYRPFIPGVVGAGIKIKGVYIAYAQKIPASGLQDRRFGKTEFRDINITFQKRIAGFQFFYQDYKGFYILQPEKFDSTYNDHLTYPKIPSLRTYTIGMNINWVFTKSFSLNAAFAQSERQKKSAGSFMLGFSERYNRLEMDTSIVPYSQRLNYPTLNKYSFGSYFSSIINLGFGYSMVGGKFSFTPVLLVGTGVQIQNYNAPQNRWAINMPLYGSLKAAFGFNGDNFFTNIIFASEVVTMSAKETRISLARIQADFGVGFRF